MMRGSRAGIEFGGAAGEIDERIELARPRGLPGRAHQAASVAGPTAAGLALLQRDYTGIVSG